MGLLFKLAFLGLISISVIFKIVYFFNFYLLAKAGLNMSSSDNELIKQLKRRFTDCFTLQKPIQNTSAYVEKSLESFYSHNACRILYNNLSYIFLGFFYILLWISFVKESFAVDKLIFLGIIVAAAYYTIDHIFSVDKLKRIFVISASDYLDNTLRNRLQPNPAAVRRQNLADEKPFFDSGSIKEVKNTPAIKKPAAVPVHTQASHVLPDKSDTDLLTSIINEFL